MTADLTLDEFLKTVCPERNLDWRKYRRASRRRVLDRIHALGLSGFSAYARYLEADPEEAAALPSLLRVTVSRFFREKETWQDLGTTVLPLLLMRIGDSRPLRVLSIGCCNGEEPYSLALLWKSGLQGAFPGAGIAIMGMDVDEGCLRRAERGVYARKTLREVPRDMLISWFVSDAQGYRLDSEVRSLVDFRRMDLLKDPLPENQDLILCRYLVFTYFHGRLRRETAKKIIQALRPKGFVVLGEKEKPGPEAEPFLVQLSGAANVYSRR